MNNNCITTYTGRHIDPLHPDPDMICIEDIAHALSLICRGNGQVKTFFSVGQHCINCAREALARGYSRRVAFACLLHDASECYLSDVPRPFKKTLSGYKEQEKNLLDLIYQKYLGSPLNAKEEQLLKEDLENEVTRKDCIQSLSASSLTTFIHYYGRQKNNLVAFKISCRNSNQYDSLDDIQTNINFTNDLLEALISENVTRKVVTKENQKIL